MVVLLIVLEFLPSRFSLSSNNMLLVFGIVCTCISYSFGYKGFPENFLFIPKGGEDGKRISYLNNFKLIHNGTYTYNYVEDNEEKSNLPTNLTYDYGVLYYRNTDYNCSGNWQIESNGKSLSYTVLVVNKLYVTSAIPSEVTINKSDDKMKTDEHVNIHMPKINVPTIGCFLLHKDDRTREAVLYNSTTSSDIKFLNPLYDCGVNMKIESNGTGKWALVQLDEGYQLHYGIFHVGISSNQLEKTFTVETIIRTSYKFALGTFLNSKEIILNCELVNSRGKKVVPRSTQCEYEINKVSNMDAGNWTMFYDIKGKHTTHKIIVHLMVHAPKIETVVEKTNSSDINLLCYVKFSAKKQFCYFQHPDGTIYRYHDFLGKEKYQFHTNYSDPTTTMRNSKYCGLTITSPDDSDFGAWRCYMGIQKQDCDWNTKVGSILHVESSSGIEHSAIQHKSSDMHVHLNETFKILCTTNKIVEHCWLQRPDKMMFEIKESAQNYHYIYEGRGFSMGDCGATIKDAKFEDSGDWKCIMKLMNDSQKVEGKITVDVTKNLVQAKQSLMIYTGSPITMSCNVIQNETFDFDYCRWIKPNGYGIHFENNKNYRLEHNHRECSLHVQELNEEGNWICVVESKIMKKIATASVNVIIRPQTNFPLILCLSATGFGVLATCVTFFLCKKRLKYQRETELQLT